MMMPLGDAAQDMGMRPRPDLSASSDAASDAGVADLATPQSPDLARTADGPPAGTFPEILSGPWLIGWSGGLDHFSWVIFDVTKRDGGNIWVVDPMGGGPAWTPYYGCSGAGTWLLAQNLNTVQLLLPNNCNPNSSTLHFNDFMPANGPFKGAILQSSISALPQMMPLNGYKFPDAQCPNHAMCTLPQ